MNGALITSSYSELISAPASGSVKLGLGSKFKLVATAVKPQQVALTVTADTSYTITAPAMQIGDSVVIDFIQEEANVVIASGYDLYLNAEIDIYNKIAGTT